jgi:ribosomal protein S18 acetylase RimI-like enzyme
VLPHLVRPARPDDLPLLADIERTAGELFAPYGFAPSMSEVITPPADLRTGLAEGALFVAEADGAVVGFALASPLDGGMHLNELDVLPSHGRRGIGSALVAAVVDCTKRRGLPYLTLSTLRSVPWNAPWYERLGFRVLGPAEVTPVLRSLLAQERSRGLPMEDRVLMKRTLGPGPR